MQAAGRQRAEWRGSMRLSSAARLSGVQLFGGRFWQLRPGCCPARLVQPGHVKPPAPSSASRRPQEGSCESLWQGSPHLVSPRSTLCARRTGSCPGRCDKSVCPRSRRCCFLSTGDATAQRPLLQTPPLSWRVQAFRRMHARSMVLLT